MSEHFTIKELAALWKVSDDTIRRRMKEIPKLEVKRIGRLVRIPEDQAQRILTRIEEYGHKK